MDTETLLEAVRRGDLEKIRETLAAGPELLNAQNERGQSAVLLAKYHRQEDALRLLLERGAELNIWEAAAVGNNSRVMDLLDERPELLSAYSQDGFTPLGLAAFFGSPAIVHNLLAKGADPNAASENPLRVAPLHSAVAGRGMESVRLLVEAGADVNARQQGGFTALHGAANTGDIEMIRYLLERGASPLARADNGMSPLDIAMTKGHAEAAHLLETS